MILYSSGCSLLVDAELDKKPASDSRIVDASISSDLSDPLDLRLIDARLPAPGPTPCGPPNGKVSNLIAVEPGGAPLDVVVAGDTPHLVYIAEGQAGDGSLDIVHAWWNRSQNAWAREVVIGVRRPQGFSRQGDTLAIAFDRGRLHLFYREVAFSRGVYYTQHRIDQGLGNWSTPTAVRTPDGQTALRNVESFDAVAVGDEVYLVAALQGNLTSRVVQARIRLDAGQPQQHVCEAALGNFEQARLGRSEDGGWLVSSRYANVAPNAFWQIDVFSTEDEFCAPRRSVRLANAPRVAVPASATVENSGTAHLFFVQNGRLASNPVAPIQHAIWDSSRSPEVQTLMVNGLAETLVNGYSVSSSISGGRVKVAFEHFLNGETLSPALFIGEPQPLPGTGWIGDHVSVGNAPIMRMAIDDAGYAHIAFVVLPGARHQDNALAPLPPQPPEIHFTCQ